MIVACTFIITYQVITGNYSGLAVGGVSVYIITYQVITGNYSLKYAGKKIHIIITYQVITGNYSTCNESEPPEPL